MEKSTNEMEKAEENKPQMTDLQKVEILQSIAYKARCILQLEIGMIKVDGEEPFKPSPEQMYKSKLNMLHSLFFNEINHR